MLNFDEATHTYRYDGKKIPSVTTILNTVFPMPLFIKKEALETSARFGTAFHKTVELYEDGNLGEYDPLMEPWMVQYRSWRDAMILDGWEPIPELSECRVFNERRWYAGTVDQVWYREKGKTRHFAVVDLKTGVHSNTWQLQLAAYARAIKLYDVGATGSSQMNRCAVRVTGEAYECHWYPCASLLQDFNVFLSALNIHRYKNGG